MQEGKTIRITVKYIEPCLICLSLLGTFSLVGQNTVAHEATSGSATASPQFARSGGYKAPPNKLAVETESAKEKSDVGAVIPEGRPREIIARYADKYATKSGPPFLQSGQLQYIHSEALKQMFPNELFYVLRFRIWPIPFEIPAPLKYNNIFVVDSKGQLKLITDAAQLETFYRIVASSVGNEKSAKEAVKSWLDLSCELNQDGFFKFSFSENINVKSQDKTLIAEGKANIEPRSGDEGFLSVCLTFDDQGRLKSARESRDIKEGMRPICQSSKLLDPDPIVRQMARKDLLLLGRRAKDYLDEKRKEASPELQKEIDRIWLDIVRENRN